MMLGLGKLKTKLLLYLIRKHIAKHNLIVSNHLGTSAILKLTTKNGENIIWHLYSDTKEIVDKFLSDNNIKIL